MDTVMALVEHGVNSDIKNKVSYNWSVSYLTNKSVTEFVFIIHVQ